MKCEHCGEDLPSNYTSALLMDDVHVRHCRNYLSRKMTEVKALALALKHEAQTCKDAGEFLIDAQVRLSDILTLIEDP
jgi:hypothetical protein